MQFSELRERVGTSRPLLSLALGAYAGMLAAVLVVSMTGEPYASESVLQQVATIAVVVAVLSLSISDLGVLLSRTRGHYVLVALPFVVAGLNTIEGYVAIGPDPVSPPERVVLGYLVTAILAGVVVLLANNRHVQAVVADRDPAVTWTARRSKSYRYGTKLLVVGGSLLGLVGVYVDLLTNELLGTLIGTGIGKLFVSGGDSDDATEFAVYPAGLVLDQSSSGSGRIIPWSRFSGYRITDDAVQLHRRPFKDLHCAREDVEDLKAVRAALDRYLMCHPS